ncbi:hypothetical protein TUM4445_23110 [Shewanella sp. MBTL60-112-B2]|nr:hypothetical protein TUM4444_36960 [Shewanella sp. MBTL60-112-B1]GIU34457.1 hypothetical protein TUM4445_23110 [Shewanella sp. MBTL60-112-B2]
MALSLVGKSLQKGPSLTLGPFTYDDVSYFRNNNLGDVTLRDLLYAHRNTTAAIGTGIVII